MPGKLFSQISSALAKDPNANITEVFARFIENSPEMLATIALTGGAMEGKQAWSENHQLGQTPPPLPENQTPNASNPATDASTETPNQNPPPRPPLTKEDVAELEKSQSQYDTNDKTPEDRLQQVRAEFPDRTSPEDHALFQNLAEKYDPLALDANQPLSLMTQAKLRPGMEVPGVEGNTARINGLPPEAPALPKGGLIRGSALEQWADKAIANARGNMNMGLDPVVMSAYSVKGAALIESGVRAFADWSQQMVKEFGEGIRPHLQELWGRSNKHLGAPQDEGSLHSHVKDNSDQLPLQALGPKLEFDPSPHLVWHVAFEDGRHLPPTAPFDANRKPRTPFKVLKKGDNDEGNRRGCEGENEASLVLTQNGYDYEQVRQTAKKRSDGSFEGVGDGTFGSASSSKSDVYSPAATKKMKGIHDEVSYKVRVQALPML